QKRFDHLDFLDVEPYCTDTDVLLTLRSYTAKSFLHPRFRHRHVRYLKPHLHSLHIIVQELSDELIRCARQLDFFLGDLSKSSRDHSYAEQLLLQSRSPNSLSLNNWV